ncbi:hypothetical protein K466DRAFT_383734 [Polyporus arcularius HHB13444]|uniref:Uncharacterized protein n=1 Tax=Polyporus arcularius HHB13444 TaxID=1314778 RepID=A0A5C3NUY4_9APHY|nr:hypothetical protein K466DRAFT_383734 [Polyporus arcularius HHB13444]
MFGQNGRPPPHTSASPCSEVLECSKRKEWRTIQLSTVNAGSWPPVHQRGDVPQSSSGASCSTLNRCTTTREAALVGTSISSHDGGRRTWSSVDALLQAYALRFCPTPVNGPHLDRQTIERCTHVCRPAPWWQLHSFAYLPCRSARCDSFTQGTKHFTCLAQRREACLAFSLSRVSIARPNAHDASCIPRPPE